MYVEMYNSPKVKRFITLSGPNAGFFCGDISRCPVLGDVPDNIDTLCKFDGLCESGEIICE